MRRHLVFAVLAACAACGGDEGADSPSVVVAEGAGGASGGGVGTAGVAGAALANGGGGAGGAAASGGHFGGTSGMGGAEKGGSSGAGTAGAAGTAGKGGASGAGGGGKGGSGGSGGKSGSSGSAGQAGSPPAPDIGTVPWKDIGYGVATKEAPDATGNATFLGYAGYAVEHAWSEAWVDELYRRHLVKLGVRWLYAIQGPADPSYSGQEIGNSKICADMKPHVAGNAAPIIVAAHSSGSFVAHELFDQLFVQHLDDVDAAGKIVYFDLDGGSSGLTSAMVSAMRNAYFVYAHDGGTLSPNNATMMSLGGQYASKGGALDTNADASGCDAGAIWCVHVTLINQKPHDPSNASAQADYSELGPSHPVCTSWLGATEAAWK